MNYNISNFVIDQYSNKITIVPSEGINLKFLPTGKCKECFFYKINNNKVIGNCREKYQCTPLYRPDNMDGCWVEENK